MAKLKFGSARIHTTVSVSRDDYDYMARTRVSPSALIASACNQLRLRDGETNETPEEEAARYVSTLAPPKPPVGASAPTPSDYLLWLDQHPNMLHLDRAKRLAAWREETGQ
jgi:hypothetical protein